MSLNVTFRTYEQALKDLPENQRWRLYIDWTRQDQGPDCFDMDEPGYATAMKLGFEFISKSIGCSLTPEWIRDLHDICVNQVTRSGKFFRKGFSPHAAYGLGCMPTKEAKEEWIAEKICFPMELVGKINPDGFLSAFLELNAQIMSLSNEENAVPFLQRIIDAYELEVKTDNPKGKLMAIGRLCRALTMFHVFHDGNLRTISFAILTKLLIEEGFSPVMLTQTNALEGMYSASQMADHLEEGMQNFRKACRKHFHPPAEESEKKVV